MALAQDRGICLRKIDYSETSQILAIFTRGHGLVRVIAKGAHRRTKAGASKFGGGVDLLELGDAVFTYDAAKELQTLTEWGLRDGHLALRQQLRPSYLGQYAAELISHLLQDHDPHEELFDLLEALLQGLQTPRREELFLAFELALLRETGYLPLLASCAVCGRPTGDSGQFSVTRGGVVCRSCESTMQDRSAFDPRLLRLMQLVLTNPARLPQLTRHQTDPVNRLLAAHIQHTLSRRLRLVPYVVGGEIAAAAMAT